jgi:hypothetical protein
LVIYVSPVSHIIDPDDPTFVFNVVDDSEPLGFQGFECGELPLQVVTGMGIATKKVQDGPDGPFVFGMKPGNTLRRFGSETNPVSPHSLKTSSNSTHFP